MAVQVGISYFDGSRLRRSLLAAADWVAAGRDELNRLNVFPVPDGDTGTNMCLTLRAVAQALRAKAADLARAIRTGFDHLRASLDEPVEGTILTVARETAEEAGLAHAEPDLRVFMVRLVRRAEAALQRTPDLLAALKTAGVVDAGAKGFVRFLEGVKRLIEDGQVATGAVDRLTPNAAAQAEVSADRDYRFCTELLVRGASLPPAADVRRALRAFGGSIVVLQAGDLVKAHVHTDTPDAVFQAGATWGTVEYTKADDMRAQHQALQAPPRRPIAFVSDTARGSTRRLHSRRRRRSPTATPMRRGVSSWLPPRGSPTRSPASSSGCALSRAGSSRSTTPTAWSAPGGWVEAAPGSAPS